jgi:hypothetical protein
MSKDMTALEFITEYGDVDVTFSYYYKYTFTYSATLPDGKILKVQYGGNSDQIYRHEVDTLSVKVRHLGPFAGSVYEGDDEVESFYDY